MNKESFWAGIGMLTLPPVLYGFVVFIKVLAESGINWEGALIGFLAIAYVGTALYLIVNGLKEKKEVIQTQNLKGGKRK